MNLPIDLIPNTRPKRFRWRQVVDTIAGIQSVEHEGALPPAVEDAVAALIMLARSQANTIAELSDRVDKKPEPVVPQGSSSKGRRG